VAATNRSNEMKLSEALEIHAESWAVPYSQQSPEFKPLHFQAYCCEGISHLEKVYGTIEDRLEMWKAERCFTANNTYMDMGVMLFLLEAEFQRDLGN
jgi:hypothetical protein